MDKVTAIASIAYGFAGFELNPEERLVSHAGEPVKLGARAFDVLMALIERRDRTVTKDELFDIVWPGLVVEESNLQVHVSALRKLFGQGVIATIPGRGYRFVAPLDDRSKATEALAAAVPSNLPQQRTQFIGRARELAQCTVLLRDARLLTLTGVGGCGKTRLAVQLAHQQLGTFTGGIHFVDLAPLQDAQGAMGALAGVIDVRERVGTSLLDRIVEKLAPRRALILFDNCEHVIDAVVELCDALLDRCPQLKIVTTSREGLGIDGEQLYSVQQMSLPATHDLAAMDASEAVRLLLDRARLATPDLQLTEGNASVVADICRRLDGIALAIELAAARTTMLSFEGIRDRLDDRFRLLSGGRRALPRHQTLLATMQWSYELLSAEEQHMFRHLAVFSGGCTLGSAASIAGSADEYEALQVLTRLHDKSLLQVDRGGLAQPRYRMLETVRQYAQERLQDAGEGEAARDRHLAYFAAVADEADAESSGPNEGAWLARLRLEQENLLAAHAWAERPGESGETSLRLVVTLGCFWRHTDQLACGLRLAQGALRFAGADVDPRVRAGALIATSRLIYLAGRYEESAREAEIAIDLARGLRDTRLLLGALRWHANALAAAGETDRPLALFEECRKLARSAGELDELSGTLVSLGEMQRHAGDLEQAAGLYSQAIELERETGSAAGLCAGLGNLTRALIGLGRLEDARAALFECIHVADSVGLRSTCSCALDPAAGLAQAFGDSERAARYYGAGESARNTTCHVREPVDEAFIFPLMNEARMALGAERYAAAETAGREMAYDAAVLDALDWLGLANG